MTTFFHRTFGLFFLMGASLFASDAGPAGYILILNEPSVAARFQTRETLAAVEAVNYRQQIEQRQAALKRELAARKIRVTSSVKTLMNAIFVAAGPEQLAELRALPGVKAVLPQRRYKLSLNKATGLLNAPGAWNALGGQANGGKGVMIAMLDTGIDETHPAFQSSLAPPAGFSPSTTSNYSNQPQFTNNKVIVARSYVPILAAGSSAANPAADSRPDDYSARDRTGHGTATASCAGAVTNSGPGATFSGMAPAVYLGNYKIFGSPGVNGFSSDAAIITALEDALSDGMNIASVSLGGPAFSGPLDSGSACGNPSGTPCDPLASAVETATQSGMVVVVAAGNAGPALNTIGSPADAPSAIAVGATSNSHAFTEGLQVPGASVPSNLANLQAVFGDGPTPNGAYSAPLVDVTKLGNDGYGCSGFPAGSLNHSFALLERGPAGNACSFLTKASNAEAAGAIGVVIYNDDASAIFGPGGLSRTHYPAMMISNSDGAALKSFIDGHAGQVVTMNPSSMEVSLSTFNELASFSSIGPATGTNGLKPELVATGENVYMAAENYDPLGDIYSADRYAVANGTSFSAPLTAGAAAMVLQAHPSFTPAQVKSALVNAAAASVTTGDAGNAVSVREIGAGLLDAGAAVSQTVTANPATVSFGALNGAALPVSQQVQLTNTGSGAVNLTLTAPSNVSVSPSSLALAAGASGTVTATVNGTLPAAGVYEGQINVTGAPAALHIPFLYLVGSGQAATLIPLSGDGFDGTVGQSIPDGALAFKLIDNYGVPVSGAPVSFTVDSGSPAGASLSSVSGTTDNYGIAYAVPTLGATAGQYGFTGSAAGISYDFTGTARPVPTITAGGIVNGASFQQGAAVAPGSYISIFGTGLSDVTDSASYLPLPLSLDSVLVSFDVPSAGINVPGHLIYISPTQINVQVPWELQGQTSAQVKVTIDFSYGSVVNLTLANTAPAFFVGSGSMVAALDAHNAPISATNPAVPGQTIQLYANGLGPVSNQPASGEPATSGQLAKTATTPTVTIGGQNAAVQFSGLAPGFPGLYQVNAVVPSGLSAGPQTITVAIGGVTSPAASIQIQ